VPVADLGDRGHVDGVVDPPVPAPREPVHLPVPRRHLDRGGPVVSGEAIAVPERDTSSTSPSTIPAMTGPTPNTSVSVVPEAFTAAASFFFTWPSWASMRRRSSRKSAASSQRATMTAADGTASCSRRAA
jgi:hypothetical protein